ncbi:MAG: class I SAM-dependent methyltransferase [Erysipelotrichaceae bacterium]|nr:class I SAM-dependent methyltransferase [Erysipelotrichaceae bacterium]
MKEKCDMFIFNLGYLPNSDELSVTDKETSLIAFKKAYDLLKENGYIIITFYLGHPGGKEEYQLIDEYIKDKNLNVLETYSQDKTDSPVTYIIKKSL